MIQWRKFGQMNILDILLSTGDIAFATLLYGELLKQQS